MGNNLGDLSLYSQRERIDPLLDRIHFLSAQLGRTIRIMEVCGTHTVSIFKSGLRSLLPEGVELISGPGCPVCVTSQGDIDGMIELAMEEGVRVVTFGDMLKVPGSTGSLKEAMAKGAKVDVVYSPVDALAIAKDNPGEQVVFLGIGFETTAPAIASTILRARAMEIRNFSVYSTMKLIPPALHALLSSGNLEIHALLCPGHVSAIIGADAYGPIAQGFSIPCVVAGFEAGDILLGILEILSEISEGRAEVKNMYPRAVKDEGNKKALEIMNKVLEPEDAIWRGLGTVEESGLGISKEYKEFCARTRFGLTPRVVPEPKGCRCSEVLKGAITPRECPLFRSRCTPLSPVGPCMVSTEGTCQAYYQFGGEI